MRLRNTLAAASLLACTTIFIAGFTGCPTPEPQPAPAGEGEGEGEGAVGEGEGEGEGVVGEGEGEGAVGEGEGEGDTRDFTCEDKTVTSQTACADDSDCGIGLIGTDCCGSQAATGVNAFDICGFMGDASGCFVDVCDCVAHPTVADDGSVAATSDENATVHCQDGACTTSFPATP